MTNDKQRERLVELIQASVNGCARNWAEVISDYLFSKGIIVPPCKVGGTAFCVLTGLYYLEDGVYECTLDAIEKDNICRVTYIDIVGIRVSLDNMFSTKEEAEKAMKGVNEK